MEYINAFAAAIGTFVAIAAFVFAWVRDGRQTAERNAERIASKRFAARAVGAVHFAWKKL